jgi:hypothetical protein
VVWLDRVINAKPCGSGLAREGGRTDNILFKLIIKNPEALTVRVLVIPAAISG